MPETRDQPPRPFDAMRRTSPRRRTVLRLAATAWVPGWPLAHGMAGGTAAQPSLAGDAWQWPANAARTLDTLDGSR